MEACQAYKSGVGYDEPTESYEWLPTSYTVWSSGNGNDGPYSSNENSSPITYSQPSFSFSYTMDENMFNAKPSSDIPSTSSSWSQELVTPPVTPQQCREWHPSMSTQMASGAPMDTYFQPDDFADGHVMVDNNLYLPEDLQLPLGGHAGLKRPLHPIKRGVSDTYPSFNSDPGDPALTQRMFIEAPHTPTWQAPYMSRGTYSMPKTIAPKATVQTLFHSSPPAIVDRLSPTVTPISTDFEYGLDSSPLPVPSRAVVPSQNSFTVFNSQCKQQVGGDRLSFPQSLQGRTSRRSCLRKTLRSVADKPQKDHNDRICNEVIPANAFICTFPGCVDKARGKPKSFKRQEHRKRHEKTVHGINGEIFKISCWVPQCPRSFTRTDNLKSHFKTHGKNSSTSRNRYVATLDESSQFNNPHWRGELTDDGFPVAAGLRIHQCWVQDCRKKYHLQSKLKTHLLQHHGRKSSNPTVSYVATLDESSDLFDPDWKGEVNEAGAPIR